jgi:hypothetical protein
MQARRLCPVTPHIRAMIEKYIKEGKMKEVDELK